MNSPTEQSLNPGSAPGAESQGKSVIIVMTSGPSQAGRCATPFYLATLLASMEACGSRRPALPSRWSRWKAARR
jgi:hypothetical protein